MDSCVEDGPEEARLGGGPCHMGKYKESKTVTVRRTRNRSEIMGAELTYGMMEEPRITPVYFSNYGTINQEDDRQINWGTLGETSCFLMY